MERKLKKSLAIMLSAVMIVANVPLGGFVGIDTSSWFDVLEVSAAEDTATALESGSCGDNLTYSYDTVTTTFTISGTGEMYDYPAFSNTYELLATAIVIEDGVTSIGEDAFMDFELVETVSLGSTLEAINDFGFSDCIKLKEIVIPDSVTYLGEKAFKSCESLEKVTLSENIKTIEDDTFKYCESLKEIVIPNSVTYIGESAFAGCKLLESVTLSENLTEIDEDAFEDCTSLKSIVIPDSVLIIEEDAFKQCFALESVTLGASVEYIGESAFEECEKLGETVIPDSVTYIGEGAFVDTAWLLNQAAGMLYSGNWAIAYCGEMPENTDLVLKDGIKYIATDAFYDYDNLISVTMPDSIVYVGEYAFVNCDNLTNIDFSENLEVIDEFAFAECYALTKVEIPDSVTEIDYYAFLSCTKLSEIKLSNSLEVLGNNAFEGTAWYESQECGLLYLDNWLVAFKSDGTFEFDLDLTIADGTIGIAKRVFTAMPLTSVVMPDSVLYIGARAFDECKWLTSISISSNTKNIGVYAFADCELLNNIVLPESITYLGYNAFEGCESLEKMTLVASITEIPEGLFNCCTNLKEVEILGDITSIGSHAFAYCENLASLDLPASLTSVEESAFKGTTAFTTVNFAGSEDQWNKIEIDNSSNGNEYLNNANIIFNHICDYAEVVTPPTCSEEGYIIYTCECGKTYTEVIPATGEHVDADGDGICDICENEIEDSGSTSVLDTITSFWQMIVDFFNTIISFFRIFGDIS